MKKFIALLMGLTLVFSFTACGNTSPSNSSQNETSVDEQETSQSEASAEETLRQRIPNLMHQKVSCPLIWKQNRKMEKHWIVYYSGNWKYRGGCKLHSDRNKCRCF